MGTTVHPDAERLAAYDQQVRRMVADPDMRGQVLAVGLALAWVYREDGPFKTTIRRIEGVAKLQHHRVKEVIRDDAPRYEPRWNPYGYECEAQMIRRPGLCGRKTVYQFNSLNWEDGTRTERAFCRRHESFGKRLEAELGRRDLRLRLERGGPPRPPANVGGLLQRHFPGVDWDKLYLWARPGWKPPERVPASYSTPVPALQLISGAETPEQVVGEPPALTVLHGLPDRLAGKRSPRRPRPGGSAS